MLTMHQKRFKDICMEMEKLKYFRLPFHWFQGNKKWSFFLFKFSPDSHLIFSQLSAYSIISIPSEIYAYGSQYMNIILTFGFVVLTVNYMFLPLFFKNNFSNCYTVSEFKNITELKWCFYCTFVILVGWLVCLIDNQLSLSLEVGSDLISIS